MDFDIRHFFKPSRTTIEPVVLPSFSIESLRAQLRLYHPDTMVRVIRGRKSAKSSAFFDESAAALQFPDYFGENWDAFEECLQDLAEDVASHIVIVVTDAARLLADADPTALAILLGILSRADPGTRGQKSPRLRVLLAERENALRFLEQRLAKVGINAQTSSDKIASQRAKMSYSNRMESASADVPTRKEQAPRASGAAAD